MTVLADRQLVAVNELSEWCEDVADGVGSQIVLLEVPRRWGRSSVLDRLAEAAKLREDDPVSFLFRISGRDLPGGRGVQAAAVCGLLADAGTRHPVAKALGLDRPAGVAALGIGVGSLFVSGFGVLAAMLLGQEAVTAAGNLRDSNAAGQVGALARLARLAAQLSAKVPVVVLIDDADCLDLNLALMLLENLTFRYDGQMLVVAAVDPRGPLAAALRKGDRAWQAGRVFAVDVDPDMGPQSRVALARELCPGLNDVLTRRIGQRTVTFAHVFAVAATTERAAELSAGGDDAGALTAVDAVIDAVMRGADPSAAAVMVAWAGGAVHARQVARALAAEGEAALAEDPDLAYAGAGAEPVIRLADPTSPRFAVPVGRLEMHVRRVMAAAVLREAATICADSLEPVVGRIVAGRAAHHIRRDMDERLVSPLLQVQGGLIADLEAVGDIAAAAQVAAEARADCPTGDRYEHDRRALDAAVLRLASAQKADEQDPLVAELIGEAISGGATIGLEARVWAAVNLLGMPGRSESALGMLDQVTTELDIQGDLGKPGISWRLLLAFRAAKAGYPSFAQPLLAPLLTSREHAVADAAARVLRAINDPHADARLQIETLELELRTAGSEDDLLRLHAALAGAYGEIGNYRHAQEHAQLELPLRQRLQGPDHPATLTAGRDLSLWTGRAGDPAGARDLFDGLVLIHEHVLGPRHPDTLTARMGLATWTGQAGNPARARDLYADLLPITEQVLGGGHPDTLTTRNNLARWTGEAGNPARARDLYAELLPIHERVFGPDHPDTLITFGNLADWTGDAGNPARARDLFAELLPIHERVLGPDHPDTLITRGKLASWTGEAGDPAGARDLYAGLVPLRERVLGPDHPAVLTTRGMAARFTGEAGDPARARDLFTELLPDLERVLGSQHPDTLTTRGALARWIGMTGDPARARDLFTELLPDLERVLGPMHPFTLNARGFLAGWTGEAGDPARARDLFAELVPALERVLGPMHPFTLSARNNLAHWTDMADRQGGY